MRILPFAIALALLPAQLAAAERPDWAFPPPGVAGAPRPVESGELKGVPGSTRTYTQSQILAGQSPVNIARQLYLMATGERAGSWAVLMKGVVEKLTNDDIVSISAYIASLEP